MSNVNDLTTLSSLKAYSQGQITDDSLAAFIITAVSYKIQNICGQWFNQNDYVEFQNTLSRQTRAQVKNKPLNSVNSIRWGYAQTIQISYAGAAINASCQVTPFDPITNKKYLKMRTITAGLPVDQSIDISYDTTTNATTAQLCASINALSNGFNATVQGNFNVPTRWLFPSTMNLLTAGTNNIGYFAYPYLDIFTYVVDQENGTFEFQPLSAMDYFFDNNIGFQLHFPTIFQSLVIDYNGGYSTIPYDLQQLTNELALENYLKGTINPNILSETEDQYSYTLADQIKINIRYLRDRLAPYMEIPLAGGLG